MGNAAPLRARAPLFCALGAISIGTLLLLSRRVRSSGDAKRALPAPAVAVAPAEPPPAAEEFVADAPQDLISEESRAWVSSLIQAASSGKTAEVSSLLGSAQAPQSDLLNIEGELPNWPNVTAVASAAIFGEDATLQLLLDAKADPNKRCQKATSWDGAFNLTNRETALCIAAQDGHLACVKALLLAGADPNIECESEYMEGAVEWGEDDDGTETHYYMAVDAANMGRHNEIAELITQHGGKKIVKSSAKPIRVRITQGSRMGA